MKRQLLIAAFVLGSATFAQAQSADTSSQAGNLDISSGKPLSVTVKSVDEKNHLITFQAPIAPGAKIDQNGQQVGLNQLKDGDQVRASFDPKTGSVLKVDVMQQSGKQGGQQGQQQGGQQGQQQGGQQNQ